MNKTVELYNSALLYTYAICDKRFYELVILMKKWNKYRFPNATKRLNSYSFVLMILTFMIKLRHLPALQMINRPSQGKIIKY